MHVCAYYNFYFKFNFSSYKINAIKVQLVTSLRHTSISVHIHLNANLPILGKDMY